MKSILSCLFVFRPKNQDWMQILKDEYLPPLQMIFAFIKFRIRIFKVSFRRHFEEFSKLPFTSILEYFCSAFAHFRKFRASQEKSKRGLGRQGKSKRAIIPASISSCHFPALFPRRGIATCISYRQNLSTFEQLVLK